MEKLNIHLLPSHVRKLAKGKVCQLCREAVGGAVRGDYKVQPVVMSADKARKYRKALRLNKGFR